MSGPIVVDIETTMRGDDSSNPASPFDDKNEIVLLGIAGLTGEPVLSDGGTGEFYNHDGIRFFSDFHKGHLPGSMFIGHNLSFDLLYLLKKGVIDRADLATCTIWDTQLAHYILTGQADIYPSLEKAMARYHLGGKTGSVAEDYFAKGLGAEHVPKNLLRDYLKGDLIGTRNLFIKQFEDAESRGMMPLMLSQMNARQATIEMEFNGMKVDPVFLTRRIGETYDLCSRLEAEVQRLGSSAIGHTVGHLFNPSSPQQMSYALFGGLVPYEEVVQVGTYKNGKPKFQKKKAVVHTPGFGFIPSDKWKNARGYSTSDDVLAALEKEVPKYANPVDASNFLRWTRELRAARKSLSTYYEPLYNLRDTNDVVHPSINHVSTATGRLSCTHPNLQNQSDKSTSDVKSAFRSRWGSDGSILELDFSQLEVVVLAVLSGDKQLQADIRDGVDMHSELYHQVHGKLPSKEQRRKFKRGVFALIYGAGAKGIAEQAECDLGTGNRIKDAFYERYSAVNEFYESVRSEVLKNRTNSDLKDSATGIPLGTSCYVSPLTKRTYTFREYVNDHPWAKKKTSFSPQQMQNYPIQGTATGDIVPLLLGRIYSAIMADEELMQNCRMVMTVHDSVVFDVKNDTIQHLVAVLEGVLKDASAHVEEVFECKFPLKLEVGMSAGPTWFAQLEFA